MWNKEELEWLDRNKEFIDSKDEKKLVSVLPTGNSRTKVVIMLTLFMGEEFKVIANNVRPSHKLFKITVYTTLFSKLDGLLYEVDGTEWVYKNDKPQPEEVEAGITRLFSIAGIPKGFIKEALEKSTLGIGE